MKAMVEELAASLQNLQLRIKTAALQAGRRPEEIKLVVAAKYARDEELQALYSLGIKALGENRVQDLRRRQPLLPADIEWHFIGHLQTNKVKYLIGKVALIHSLDRWALAEELARRAENAGWVAPVLVQVNVAAEPSKHGLRVEEVADFLTALVALPGVKPYGFMTVAPLAPAEEVRWVFRRLRELACAMQQKFPFYNLRCLSMGMSNDFEVAIAEGATIIRVGSAIFGR